MRRDAENINILHVCVCAKKTRAEATQQLAVPHRILSISGKRPSPSDTYIYIHIIYIIYIYIYIYNMHRSFILYICMVYI
jgi:hypothetical protein